MKFGPLWAGTNIDFYKEMGFEAHGNVGREANKHFEV